MIKKIKWFIKTKIQRKQLDIDKPFQINKKFAKKYPQYSIGRGSYGLPIVHDWNEGATLKIGSFCSIAADVNIYLGGNHRLDWVTTYPFAGFLPEKTSIRGSSVSKGDVNIGSDVWLCANSIILSGVTIGHGAVIANGAVVSKDVEPYSVVAGNPAKHVKYRFEAEIIERLLASEWWHLPDEIIESNIDKLSSSNINAFLDFVDQRLIKDKKC